MPQLKQVHMAHDLSKDVTALTALVDAEVQNPGSGSHGVCIHSGTCSVDAACQGSCCMLLVAEVSEPLLPEESRAHVVLMVTQARPQNLREACRAGSAA